MHAYMLETVLLLFAFTFAFVRALYCRSFALPEGSSGDKQRESDPVAEIFHCHAKRVTEINLGTVAADRPCTCSMLAARG